MGSLAFNLFFVLLIFKRGKQIQESLQDVDFLKVRARPWKIRIAKLTFISVHENFSQNNTLKHGSAVKFHWQHKFPLTADFQVWIFSKHLHRFALRLQRLLLFRIEASITELGRREPDTTMQNPNCILPRFPYFTNDYIEIQSQVRNSLHDSYKIFLKESLLTNNLVIRISIVPGKIMFALCTQIHVLLLSLFAYFTWVVFISGWIMIMIDYLHVC